MAAVPGYPSDLTQGPINSHDLSRVFGGSSTGHNTPLVSRRSREFLIGEQSFDPANLALQKKFFGQMAKDLPPRPDPISGLSPDGVYADWAKGMSVSGYMADPIGYAPVRNGPLREKLGLSSVIPKPFLSIVKELSTYCFGEWVEADINVTPGSSAGWIGFRKDADWKRDYAKFVFEPSRIQKFLDMAFANDDVAFANEFETVWAYYAQKRDQIDSPDKKRLVYGYRYACDPEKYPNDHMYADKVVKDKFTGKVWPDHSATRARLINAAPWAINVVLSSMSTGVMRSMFRRHPDVWHVNTPDHIERLINYHHVFHADASEFDQSHPTEALDALHEGASEFWDQRLVYVSQKLLYAPYYARPLSLVDGASAWVGKLFGGAKEVQCGNRSGHALTSLLNKILMVAAYLYALHLAGYDVIGNMKYWLDGEGPIKFINNGDDTILYSKDRAALDVVIDKFVNKKTAIYAVALEKGGVFNGMPTILADSVKLIYKCVPNALNSISKIITPERPIYNPSSIAQLRKDEENGKKIFRKYWYLGLGDKIANAYKDSVTNHVFTTFVSMWATERRGSLTIPEMLDAARLRVPPIRADLTDKDLQVLDDPRKLHYKFTRDEISPEVLEQTTSKVESITFLHFIKTAFKGTIVSKEQLKEDRENR